jgi:hypothetical protein
LELSRMVLRAAQVFKLQVMGRDIPALDPATRLSIKWPQWYAPTADDRQRTAQTVVTLVNAGLLSRTAAVTTIADVFDITDIPSELRNITDLGATDE